MKVKEIERTVNTSWSPVDYHPILLAAGTAAQQLDASFNTSAALEIYALNLTEPSLDLELKTSVPSAHRFHKVSWGGTGAGIIVGGCDNGVLQMYNVSKLLEQEDSLIANPERHSGPVRALDFNPFQKNLLATGATNSEIFIWDMNNTATPMTPGSKSQPFEDVAWLAWNRQVQHILASTFPTRSIVWDLRKNEPIIKLTDTTTRVRWKVVSWHPEVATQLCLASEEDTSPLIQLWDLRFATAPVKTFHGHTRGVLSLAWCSQDPDLLISSGKDNKIFCWNPNTNAPDGEIVCEIPNSQQWIFDVSWCPRNPSLIVSSSCDGHTSIYSLSGGGGGQMQISNNKIAESFPGMGDYSETQLHAQQPVVNLKNAPKWLKKQSSARFGFGGKLVTVGNSGVNLLQVHEDSSFLERASQLDQKIAEGRFHEICQGKQDPVWRFLEASFSPHPRVAIADLLGYNRESVLQLLGLPKSKNDVDHLSGQFSTLGQDGLDNAEGLGQSNFVNSQHVNGGDVFENLSAQQTPEKNAAFKIQTENDVDGRVCKALLVGGVEEAIEICLNENKMADALILAMAAGPDTLAKTQLKYFQKREGYLTNIISALVSEDWSFVIQNCELTSWKEALTAILTYSCEESLPELCRALGERLEQAGGEFSSCADICYIASGNVAPLIHKRTSEVTLTPSNIQDLVELVLVAKAAMASHGHNLPIVGDVANLIVNYGEILAAQGDLVSALKYLNDSQDEKVVELRTRLGCALGETMQSQYPVHMGNSQMAQQPSKQIVQNMRKQSIPFQTVQQNQHLNSFGKPSNVGQPPVPPSPVPMSNYGMPAPQVPKAMPAHTPAPPPPGNAFTRNSPSPQIQGSTMKKYVVDPSVGGGGYNRGPSQMYNHQGSHMPMFSGNQVPSSVPNFQSPPVSSFNTAVSMHSPSFSSFQPPPVSTYQQATPSQFQPNVGGAGDGRFNPNFPPAQHYKPAPPAAALPAQEPSHFTPAQNFNYNQPGMANQEIPSAQHGPASGWNDPPVLTPRSNQPKQEFTPQNPITHPLFGSEPPPLKPEMQASQNHSQQLAHQSMPPMQQHYQAASVGSYGEPPMSMSRPATESSQPKPPMPQHYLHIQTTFEELRNKCLIKSQNNALIKRKLDDAARKLETLYELLRNGMLSSNILSSLERLVQAVHNVDYTTGLGIITQMVSGPDFSQIATFMTGLKILLQTAQQLMVN
ncbi:protein transport protein Sec31A isoform X2 [Cimex lectularius]|uniref:Protein transport protein Sec31A n=1 Tax=Cimex lectularius TaxID=79782 RepID=A0A8I6R5M9_CIMLE|nr:protein transport protein Sec31A isoform X2 [Cimex lectularius]